MVENLWGDLGPIVRKARRSRIEQYQRRIDHDIRELQRELKEEREDIDHGSRSDRPSSSSAGAG